VFSENKICTNISAKRKHYNKINNYQTPWSRVLTEKLIFTQIVEKSPALYGIRRLITVFITFRYLSLS